jgi:hypothetical protein
MVGSGRLRRRRGEMSDLTITQRSVIRSTLIRMQPYVVFKRKQVKHGLRLLDRLPPPRDPLGFLETCRAVDEFASLNFSKSRKVTSKSVDASMRGKGVLGPRND